MKSCSFCLSGELLSVFFTSQVELCWVDYSWWEVFFFFFLTFSTYKNQGISFWPAKFLLKNLLVILWVFSGNIFFFSCCFKDSLLIFNYNVSWHGFLCIHLIWNSFRFPAGFSFLWLNNIPLYVCVCTCMCITFSLSIYLLMGTYVVPMSWLL